MVDLLNVQNLKTQFITEGLVVKAVDDVSFSLKKKEIVAIVGESGSGKSVTSLSIMQLIPTRPRRRLNVSSGQPVDFKKPDYLMKVAPIPAAKVFKE